MRSFNFLLHLLFFSLPYQAHLLFFSYYLCRLWLTFLSLHVFLSLPHVAGIFLYFFLFHAWRVFPSFIENGWCSFTLPHGAGNMRFAAHGWVLAVDHYRYQYLCIITPIHVYIISTYIYNSQADLILRSSVYHLRIAAPIHVYSLGRYTHALK